MPLTLSTSALLLVAAILSASLLASTDAFLLAPPKTMLTTSLGMARSENSIRTEDRGRAGGGGGQDYDYSGGNLKYGTGKYTQRGADGFQGGVNLSKNGRSMQDSVYREDRNNVDRARGRDRGFDSRMDEIEDMEMGGGPREGMRDRMMRGGDRDGGFYDEGGFEGRGGGGIRDRMGGSGLLRDHQEIDARNTEGGFGYDDGFGAPTTIMGGSSKGRGGGYRSSQFESNISNERRRFEDFGGRMNEYLDERDGIIDFEDRSGGSRRMRSGGSSNFDRIMGRGRDGQGDYHDDDRYDDHRFEQDDMGRGSRGMGGQFGGERDFQDDFRGGGGGEDYGSRGGGGLLRDMRRP